MKKVKVLLGSLAMISVLSMSGCALFDPFWWADGPHHGGGGVIMMAAVTVAVMVVAIAAVTVVAGNF